MMDAGRQAIRQLGRGLPRAATVAGVMALGIGACVAIFSTVSAVLLAGWPYADAGRLAIIWHARPNVPGVIGMSPGDYASYRASSQTFEHLAAVTTRGFNTGGAGTPARITCARTTPELFPMLGVPPARGRWFTDDEDRRAERVVVVSDRLWRTQLGGDPTAVGRDVLLDATPYRIVGVMPDAFVFPPEGVQGLSPADCWVPASFSPIELATPGFTYVLFARLKPDATWEQAGADANAGAQRIWASYPAAVQSQIQLSARVVPLAEQVLANSRTPLYLFAGAALFLLLIACANAANLLLTALEGRRRELAVRAALGATPGAVMTQLLIESLLLGLAGGVGGVIIARGLLAAIAASHAGALPRLGDAHIDGAVLLFAVACATVTGIAAGVAPAMQARGFAEAGAAQADRTVARGFGRRRWSRGLVAFEVALAVVVLAFAGVLARSVVNLHRVGAGFSPEGLTAFSVALPPAQYQDGSRVAGFVERMLPQLTALPGVGDAAVASAPPIGEATPGVVSPVGSAVASAPYRPALIHAVTADYAPAIGLAVRAGRFIVPADAGAVGRVAVVNETMARSLWPDDDAVGRAILRVGDTDPLTIVGIVADVRQGGLRRPPPPALYVPFALDADRHRHLTFLLRGASPGPALAPFIRRAVSEVDAALPVYGLRSGEELIAATMAAQRFNMLVLVLCAVLALGLAMSGLYAVLSHTVQEARRDFGIRQALGATAARIIWLVTSRALAPVLVGMVAGAGVAAATSVLVASLLFGVEPNDSATLVGVIVVVLIAAAGAVLIPARRAARAQVMTLLRQE